MPAAMTTRSLTLGYLLGSAAGSRAAIEVTDLVVDSRQVTPGAAFIALRGTREHGARYAAEALQRGARVVLYEPGPEARAVPEPSVAIPALSARLGELARAFFAAPAEPVALMGVTGTNGKTTVAHLVAQALTDPAIRGDARARQSRCGYIGTLGYGVPPALAVHELTTPDCLTLHRELRELGAARAALEVSSHALAQDRVAGLRFDTAVFTNLSRDHLDAHGDFARYGEAKARLFQLPGLGTAVINMDDAFGRRLAERLRASSADVALIGTHLARDGAGAGKRAGKWGQSPFSLENGDCPHFPPILGCARLRGLAGIELEVFWRGQEARIDSPLVGDFNAENLLSALGALLAWEVPLAEACRRLSACGPVPGRMEVLGGPPHHPWVVVDYAHTPDALERTLAMLRTAVAGALWCVFGCGGDRDPGKRPLMGAVAARLADHVVLTDDNPRSEVPAAIVENIRRGAQGHPRLRVQRERRAAIAESVRQARPGDVVLVAGKGHECWQLVGGERRPFSDRAAALEALAEREARA